jgi:hypothetical protein
VNRALIIKDSLANMLITNFAKASFSADTTGRGRPLAAGETPALLECP